MFVIERSQMVAAPTEHTFSYFSDQCNLPAITPTWLRFTVTRPPDDRIFAGCEIEYTISLARRAVALDDADHGLRTQRALHR